MGNKKIPFFLSNRPQDGRLEVGGGGRLEVGGGGGGRSRPMRGRREAGSGGGRGRALAADERVRTRGRGGARGARSWQGSRRGSTKDPLVGTRCAVEDLHWGWDRGAQVSLLDAPRHMNQRTHRLIHLSPSLAAQTETL